MFDQHAEMATGLTDYLEGASTEEEAIRHDDESGIDVIAAGNHSANAADLLHSQPFATLLENAAKRYDFVLVNAPAMSAARTPLPWLHGVTAHSSWYHAVVPARLNCARPGNSYGTWTLRCWAPSCCPEAGYWASSRSQRRRPTRAPSPPASTG